MRIAGIDLPVMMPGRTAVQLQCVSALHQLLLCDTVKAPTGVPLNLTNVSIYLVSIYMLSSLIFLSGIKQGGRVFTCSTGILTEKALHQIFFNVR